MNDIRPPDGYLTWGEFDLHERNTLGMSGPPEHADRSGQTCPPHQYERAEPRVIAGAPTVGARPVEPVCSVCGAPARAFRGGRHFCRDCGR